ncbi:MAG: BON domain-containing protein [Thiobacillaceae bacterium]|jgi:osmotically-inducible protein OsmY|nr:BON domain-containing protein [Thiobacillaceae bacterium]
MQRLILATLLGLSATLPLTGCVPVVVGGAATGVIMADDRRSSNAFMGDQEIEFKAAHRLREATTAADNVHVNFTSYNQRLLITGEAPSAELKARIEEIGKGVPSVKEVFNELVIAPPTSAGTRASDSYLTTKVKARFLEDKRFGANHVKVVTENGVVFLMGLVRRDEGDAAAEVAARTTGVTRVVKVFEYIN